MNFRLTFQKPVVEVDQAIGPGGVMALVSRWLSEQDELPVGAFGPILDEGQTEADLFITAEIDDWKLKALWDRIREHAPVEVEKIPDP